MADDTTTDGRFCQEIKEDIDRVMEQRLKMVSTFWRQIPRQIVAL
jgi:hypothetical protein